MARTTRKPEKLGNIWVNCRLQVIDETTCPPRWKTVAECMWTPNAIARAIKTIRRKANIVWVLDPTGSRTLAAK